MAPSTQAHSYCVVQWEDNNNEYAVVHMKRAKTSIMLKVGLTTSFEGNNRDRRRGAKNDCTVFSFQFEDQGGHVNTYSWSLAPGLFEKIEETTKAIKNIAGGNLHRTISSSSTSSTTMSKNKKRKVNHNEQHTTDNPGVIDVNMMPVSPPAPGSTRSTITIGDIDQSLGSSDQRPSNSSNANKTSTTNTETIVSYDIDSLVQENKALRNKVNELEEQLLVQRETSIPIPDENGYNYLRSVCLTYEQCRSEQHTKMVELRKKLPCSDVEIRLAKKPNPAATINNLIKFCFKDVDLTEMSYEKLKFKNPSLLLDIHDFVKCIHAPTPIPQSMFSGTISLRCRHLRDSKKNESVSKPTKRKRNQSDNIREERTKQNYKTVHDTELEQPEDDKENDEHF
ncbi:unnamed protein product [Rotaria sp. Silwood1]|nr:unnamed protein product [Rotaria sp. Silwood1]